VNPKDLVRFIDAQKLFHRKDKILLTVSGGIDSTVMTHLFYEARFIFAIAHCNFGLRGNDSDEDEKFVKNLALKFKVPYFPKKFDTATIAVQKGISIQMAARDLRYHWFEEIRQEKRYDYIATAHHCDDQVETFLINLIRGTGIAGLHGIPVKNGTIIRPLMFAFRKDIAQYASQHQIRYRSDDSNNETKYLRNKIRHEVITLLCSINPDFPHGLTESIRRIGEFEQIGECALDSWCKDTLTTDGKDNYIDVERLLKVTPVETYVWRLLSPFGFNETQVSDLVGCLGKENRKIFSSSSHRLVKDREKLVISPIEPKTLYRSVNIEWFAHKKKLIKPLKLLFERISEVKIYEIPASGAIASLDYDKLQFPLTLRKWQQGDAFFPLGMKKKKKLSDFFIDQKFSLKQKEHTWLLCSGNDIVWIIGHRIDHRFRVTSSTKQILCIVMPDV
jgi:tRNA(Ile)-lysidine synthase